MFLPLRDQRGQLRGGLITHVDDLLIAAPPSEMGQLQVELSGLFPIAEWESGTFDYTGATIKQVDQVIELYQTDYVNTRLEAVEIPKNVETEEIADQVTKQDNMSTIGALFLAGITNQARSPSWSLPFSETTARPHLPRCEEHEQAGQNGTGWEG